MQVTPAKASPILGNKIGCETELLSETPIIRMNKLIQLTP